MNSHMKRQAAIFAKVNKITTFLEANDLIVSVKVQPDKKYRAFIYEEPFYYILGPYSKQFPQPGAEINRATPHEAVIALFEALEGKILLLPVPSRPARQIEVKTSPNLDDNKVHSK